jgi:hypothetical protein
MKMCGEVDIQLQVLLHSESDWSEWKTSLHARLTPREKLLYLWDMRLGWTQSQSGRRGKEKFSALVGNRIQILQPPNP